MFSVVTSENDCYLFLKHLERHRNTSSEDGSFNHSRGQPRRLGGGSRSHNVFNERTSNAKDSESPGVTMRDLASFTQLTSGVSRIRHVQREDMVPFVRYDGVVEDTKATNTHAHREVKVIVHKSTSSSSSSTVSSVRSVEQRMPSPRRKHVQSRDHFYHHRRRHQNSERSENREQSCFSHTVEKLSDGEKSIQLQVIDIVEDATHSEQFCQTSQETTKEGGSLAAMFDS